MMYKTLRKMVLVLVIACGFSVLLTAHFNLSTHADNADYEISGTVTNQQGAGLSGVEVTAVEPGGTVVDYGPYDTDSNGNYSFQVETGTYDFHFTPASGANLNTIIDSDVNVTSNETISVQLTPSTYTLSGTLTNSAGTPIDNFNGLSADTSSNSTDGAVNFSTDANGHFSVQLAPGKYGVDLSEGCSGCGAPELGSAITHLLDATTPIDLTTGNVTQNLVVPTVALTVTVKDSNGNPVSGATITADASGGTVALGPDGSSIPENVGDFNTNGTTDSTGSVSLFSVKGATYSLSSGPLNQQDNICAEIPNAQTVCLTAPKTITGNTDLVFQEAPGTPSSPTNLAAISPTNQAPSLSWTVVGTATSYNIYRNDVIVGSSTTKSFTDTSLPSDGTYSYYVTAVNSSGESAASNTISVVADTTAPTITDTVAPIADSNGYNTGNVLVTFTCADNSGGTGIASCTTPVTVPDEGVGQSVTGIATDNAGNTTTLQVNPSLLAQAVNAGGSVSGPYASDAGFYGGSTYSTTAAVDTSSAHDPTASQSVYQTVRYGNSFSYTFSNLTPNANYTLMMHYDELYWGSTQADGGGVGSRVFNVAVNGQTALNNFDIYQTAGNAANTAVVEQVAATADSNGKVTVTFTSDTDNAMVSGLALYNGTLPTESPDPMVQPTTSAMIDAGGTGAGSFTADTDYLAGSTYATSSSIDTTNVAASPAPQEVYQSDRYGNFTYTIPQLTPNKSYNVQLDFAEPYWGLNGNGGTGSREFDVSMNGTQVLNNFDVYHTAGGANKAITEDFTTTSDASGKIAIQFSSVIDNAMVSGIEVTSTN
jgi:protocatechuate 3,4-dioxygenase beta subunit